MAFSRFHTGDPGTLQPMTRLTSSTFFCYCYADRRDLHSFPTRRSSDLGSARCARSTPGYRRPPLRGYKDPARSEEHTSELQSLRHLVCRLLLEKKKQQSMRRWSHSRTT